MSQKNNILVTGGAGFIGSALCRNIVKNTDSNLIILDKLTYASNLDSLSTILPKKNVFFYKESIGNIRFLKNILLKHNPISIFNLAAETHVDNSILNPTTFIETNVLHTHNFFQTILEYYKRLPHTISSSFKLLHVSTDEVYGDIKLDEPAADESAAYNPSSPYSASKASSDHLAKAYFRTYGLPVLISNCSNNYGPFQNNEKFIPVILNNLIKNKKIPVYGSGKQIREWIYVDDHCDALLKLINRGVLGQSYNIGTGHELTNIELIQKIITILTELRIIRNNEINNYLNFITDRLGHDKRYALNSNKIMSLCDWQPKTEINDGLKKTIDYYINNNN